MGVGGGVERRATYMRPSGFFRKNKIGEVLGRTNCLLSFDKARTAQKTKKLGDHTDRKVIS
jgi:hypothetical protein